jgi:hypothetical protein
MKSHHTMTTCPGCGCAEGETPNDECWPCQTDGEARIGERMSSLAAYNASERFASANPIAISPGA